VTVLSAGACSCCLRSAAKHGRPRPRNLLYPWLGFAMLSSTTKVVFPQLVRTLEFRQIDGPLADLMIGACMERLVRKLLAIGSALLPAAVAGAQAVSMPVVQTDAGAVRGRTVDGGVAFKGMPFAAPPVGPLRWRAPQPAPRWRAVRDAGAYGHDCMQLPFPSDAAPLGTAPAEDCLYANVWRPAGHARNLPIMVWIYGGGFVNGGASPPTYTGAELARRGIMVVSFNYRLGRFGTFAHPQLTASDPDHGSSVGAAQCRRLRRGSRQNNDHRRERWWNVSPRARHVAGGQGAVSSARWYNQAARQHLRAGRLRQLKRQVLPSRAPTGSRLMIPLRWPSSER
jgi:hypothetical protein